MTDNWNGRLHMLRVFLLFVLALPVVAEPGPMPFALKMDAYGDLLPRGAVQRLGTVRWRFDDGLRSIHFAPDGKTIFGCANHHLLEYDRATGQVRRTLNVGS